MKTTKNILSLILLITVLTFTSCNSNDDDNPSDNSSDNKITLTIDNGSEIVYTDVTGVVLADKLTIAASNNDSDLQIILNSDISQGTYTSPAQIGISHSYNSLGVFNFATNMTSISFVVTSHDVSAKHIKGTYILNYMDNQDNNISHTATGTYDVKYH